MLEAVSNTPIDPEKRQAAKKCGTSMTHQSHTVHLVCSAFVVGERSCQRQRGLRAEAGRGDGRSPRPGGGLGEASVVEAAGSSAGDGASRVSGADARVLHASARAARPWRREPGCRYPSAAAAGASGRARQTAASPRAGSVSARNRSRTATKRAGASNCGRCPTPSNTSRRAAGDRLVCLPAVADRDHGSSPPPMIRSGTPSARYSGSPAWTLWPPVPTTARIVARNARRRAASAMETYPRATSATSALGRRPTADRARARAEPAARPRARGRGD